jgi:hypothetical protein
MSNSLLTLGGITRKAIQLFRNSNAFLGVIDKQYDDQFGRSGAKIGSSLRIRLPNDYTVRTGAAASLQNTSEQQVTMTVATQQGVDVSFTSADLELSMDDFAERVLAPMVNNLAGAVAANIMTGAENINNFISNVDGSGNIISPTVSTWLQAGAILSRNSAPQGDRKAVLDPLSMARAVGSMTGLFNPTEKLSRQFATGQIYNGVLGMDWAADQTVLIHTTGSCTGATVNGANQTGTSLTVNTVTGTMNVGDVFTIAGVYGVNRVTKASTGVLQQFVVTSAVANGATSISIYPAITPASGGNAVQFQTVTASPANSAAITPVVGAGVSYRKNFVQHKVAATMATADLPLLNGEGVKGARDAYDGISLRMMQQYQISSDVEISRLDILYGFLWPRPEWAVVVSDSI